MTRKTGERIQIADDIEVTVVLIKGDKVRIGVDAPKDTPIHRHEVYEIVKASKERFEVVK